MTDLAVSAGALELPGAEAAAIALIQRGRDAIGEATTMEAARSVLAQTKVLEAATRAVDLTMETITEAAALRVRAERRVGQLLAEQPKNVGTRPHGRSKMTTADDTPTLAERGISKDGSAQMQRLAAVPEPLFEQALAEAKDEAAATKTRHAMVTAGAVLRKIDPEREKRPTERWLEADGFVRRCAKLADDAPAVLASVRFGAYPGAEDPIVYAAVLGKLDRALDAMTKIRDEVARRQP
jgi:hypothetical protein